MSNFADGIGEGLVALFWLAMIGIAAIVVGVIWGAYELISWWIAHVSIH